MRIQKMLLINRAPFENVLLDFENNITVLSGINGAGKTTILSYVVDAFYELAKKAFNNEFEKVPGKYYRVSSPLFSLDSKAPSVVYIRFVKADGGSEDYVDVWGDVTQEWYEKTISIPDPIGFNSLDWSLRENGNAKHWSLSDKKTIEKLFNECLLTYFPAYRYEVPSFLNDPYKIKLSFTTDSRFSGYLTNPIEVTSDLPQITNWIMDIVLDNQLYKTASQIQANINRVLSLMLKPKTGEDVCFGIGQRNEGASRIAIMSAQQNNLIYPSVFAMSSGELSLLCLFGELLRQADNIGKNASDISGIVLIDEIDKHLHIKVQKEILPNLLGMFPNIQFIVTSHSPFFNLGFDNLMNTNHQILDMDNQGLACSPQNNELFQEVYNMLIHENERYYEQYNLLKDRIDASSKPLIITEGKTDWKHIKNAQHRLNRIGLDIEYYEYEETLGGERLASMILDYARFDHKRRIIGIFDRDNFPDEIKGIDSNEFVSLGNDVYAFAIPLVNSDEYGENISIEHYYKREHLTQQDSNGRRLFLGSEFYLSGISRDGQYETKTGKIQNKVMVNGIIDEKVFKRDDLEQTNSVAMSKSDFSDYIYKQDDFAKDFSFSSFEKIFDVIDKIVSDETNDGGVH